MNRAHDLPHPRRMLEHFTTEAVNQYRKVKIWKRENEKFYRELGYDEIALQRFPHYFEDIYQIYTKAKEVISEIIFY